MLTVLVEASKKNIEVLSILWLRTDVPGIAEKRGQRIFTNNRIFLRYFAEKKVGTTKKLEV